MAKDHETVTFHQGKLPSSLWDKKTDSPLYVFEKKYLETDDPELIARLERLGYERFYGQLPEGYTKDGNLIGASVSTLPKADMPKQVPFGEGETAEGGPDSRFTPAGGKDDKDD